LSKTFYWTPGSRIKTGAQIIGEEIDRISNGQGNITVEQYIEHATSPQSPLHNTITWDRNIAAHEWNKVEARTILRSLLYNELPGDKPRRFVYKVSDDSGKYTKTSEILINPDMRQQLITNAITELENFVNKYNHITELLRITNKINEIVKEWKEDEI